MNYTNYVSIFPSTSVEEKNLASELVRLVLNDIIIDEVEVLG